MQVVMGFLRDVSKDSYPVCFKAPLETNSPIIETNPDDNLHLVTNFGEKEETTTVLRCRITVLRCRTLIDKNWAVDIIRLL